MVALHTHTHRNAYLICGNTGFAKRPDLAGSALNTEQLFAGQAKRKATFS